MNKAGRKALIMHELRQMKWFLAVGIFCDLVFCLMLMQGTGGRFSALMDWNEYAGSHFSEVLLDLLYKGHIFVWILFAIATVVQFWDYHGRKRKEYIASLPVTNRQHFAVKAMTGYAVIAVTWLGMTLGTLLVWSSEITELHKKSLLYPIYHELLANETIWHTLRTLGIFGLELLAAYSLFLMLNAMVNNGAAAALFSLGVMAVPLELCYIVNSISFRAGDGIDIDEDVWVLEHLAKLFFGDSLKVMTGPYSGVQYGRLNEYVYIYYWNMWEVAAVLLLILAICTVVTWRLAKGQDLAGKHHLVPHMGVRIFLAIGIGVCIGSAIAALLSEFIGNASLYSIRGFLVVQITGSAILSAVAYRLLKISVR